MPGIDDLGRDEGTDLGPEPGRGKVIHDSSGEADFDGLPGDELPPREAVRWSMMYTHPSPCRRASAISPGSPGPRREMTPCMKSTNTRLRANTSGVMDTT
jgi:hypothetical protein